MKTLLALVLLAGCSTKYAFTPTSSTRAAAARPANCAFEILTTAPARPVEELGVLDVSRPGEQGPPDNINAFRSAIARDVCNAGGDVVLAAVNGSGVYIKGTVLRYTEAAQQVAAPAESPAESPAH